MLCLEVTTRASIPASSISASSWPASNGMGGSAAIAPVAGLEAMVVGAIASIVSSKTQGRDHRPANERAREGQDLLPPIAALVGATAVFSLLQAILDFVEAGARAGIVQLGAGSAGGADRPDDFVAELDDHAAAEEHHMRQLGQRHQRVLLGAFPQSKRVALERDGGVGLVEGAIERMDAGPVAAQGGDDRAVGV